MCVCVCVHVYMCVYVCVCVCSHSHMHIYMCVYGFVFTEWMHVCMHLSMLAYICKTINKVVIQAFWGMLFDMYAEFNPDISFIQINDKWADSGGRTSVNVSWSLSYNADCHILYSDFKSWNCWMQGIRGAAKTLPGRAGVLGDVSEGEPQIIWHVAPSLFRHGSYAPAWLGTWTGSV